MREKHDLEKLVFKICEIESDLKPKFMFFCFYFALRLILIGIKRNDLQLFGVWLSEII